MKRRPLKMHAPYSEQRRRQVKGDRQRRVGRLERHAGKQAVKEETEVLT